MRLVRLKLREPTPFWILRPITLQKGKEFSPLLNIDNLTDDQKNTINRSVLAHEISLYDADGDLIEGTLANANKVYGNIVPVEDVPEEADVLPEIVSVTVDEDEDEPEEDEEPITESHYEDARILVARNGNTVKKAISLLPKTEENLTLLHACLEVEAEGKSRDGVMYSIQKAISEY
jgi:hypothetical protein